MARSGSHSADRGAWLLVASAVAGLCVSLFEYFWPGTGIDGTPGALLVAVSCALVLAAALLMALASFESPALRASLNISTVLGVSGTGLAAYFLEAYVLIAFMGLGLLGWFWHVIFGRSKEGRGPAAHTPAGAI